MKISNIFAVIVLAAMPLLAACSTTGGNPLAAQAAGGQKWTGVLAVEESGRVWDIIDEAGNDPSIYVHSLYAALNRGEIESATGVFDFHPYANGRPIDNAYRVTVGPSDNGQKYFKGPSSYFRPGQAMCATASGWTAIAGQQRFPAAAGPNTNCIDFGPEAASATFANSNYNAAVIVMVKPAG